MLIRLKFDIDKVAKKLIEEAFGEVLQDPTSTFFDPSMGGGQFVKNIEQALQQKGSSADSISKRVFGFSPNEMRRNYVVKAHKLSGSYENKNFLKEETHMKFDNAITNPPYQNGKDHDFYIKFIQGSKSAVKEGGKIVVICPNRGFVPGSKLNKELEGVTVKKVWWNLTKEFEKVSTFIGALWIENTKPDDTDTPYVIKTDLGFDILSNDILPNQQQFSLNSTSYGLLKKVFNVEEKVSFVKNKDYINLERNKDFDLPISRQYRRWNSITRKGGKHTFKIMNTATSKDGRWLLLNNTKERKNAEFFLCESKLMRYITFAFSGAMNVPPFLWKSVPKIDFSKNLTDEDVFKHYGLGEVEINEINGATQ